MGVFSRLEGGLDSAFDRAAGAVFRSPIEPAQIAKRAEKQMNREKLVGAGKQYAPTLYTVLVNKDDNRKLFGFYPTMAAEIETYLMGKGTENSLKFDGRPLVRFIVDDNLKSGRFEIIAENVAAPIIAQLRDEEMEFYGLKEPGTPSAGGGRDGGAARAVPAEESGIAGASAVLPIAGVAGAIGAAGAVGAARAAGALGSMNAAGAAGAIGAADLSDFSDGSDFSDFSDGPDALDVPVSQGAMRDSLKRLPTLSTPGAAVGRARLTNHNAGKSYALTGSTMTIGRDSTCDIVIDDANVSRKHAQLAQDVVGTWKLSDLGSTNGTLLNRAPVTTALLRDGDQISIGVTVLEFRENR